MDAEIRLPQWGMGMTEGTVLQWYKQEGDVVAEGEPLVEIESAKITNVIEAPASGTLTRIVAKEDATVAIFELLGVISATDGAG
jgi:pyruvate/2-oxoglutarate dehydrogenase complex dihydrolipoamide acyltransferase (E2) component